MTTFSFSPKVESAFDARFNAQRIAFGPVVFQCVHYAWKRGMLEALARAGEQGADIDTLAAGGSWSAYALKVALESCLSAGVVRRVEGRYQLDKTGYCLLSDRVTQVNFDFVQDVCYRGLADLHACLDTQRPLGLCTLGPWPTLYEGITELPEPASTSWFAFDHLYSDTSFPLILKEVLSTSPRQVMDIGANTGKFSQLLLQTTPDVSLHLVDLPRPLEQARRTLELGGVASRARLHACDMLAAGTELPGGMDLIWMSQFLSCFGEAQISAIFHKVRQALAPGGQVLILDTLWDRQRYDIAAFCLINTSPYFTAMASGNSKIYEATDYIRLAADAGLTLTSLRDGIGYAHCLMRLEPR